MSNRRQAWAVETKAIRDDGEGTGGKRVKKGMKVRVFASGMGKKS